MQKIRLHKLSAAIAVALTLAIGFTTLVSATGQAAPVAQGVRAQEVRGVLTGGQFAQIWLGLVPEVSGAQVTVVAEWDRSNPASSGLNFFLLDEQGVRRVGEEPMSSIALGAGNPDFDVNAPDNTVGASFNANGFGPYTIVVSNESSQDASFTLRVTNGFILDDSNQVTDPSSPVTTTQTTETTETTAAVTETTTTEIAATATPVATTAAVTTTTETTTTVAEAATPAATTAPAATGTPGVVRTLELSGELPVQDAQHFLGLQPDGSDVQMTLRLTFDPQDNSELARRLNFWVLTQSGFQQVIDGANASDVAIAAGNRVFRGQNNERVASFRSSGTGAFTVIVYNNATVPGSYTLSVEGGLLIDDNAQTNEGKAASSTVITTTGSLTTTTATTTTTAAPAPAASTATTTTVATGRTGEPGGSYTVKSGDTLALIARDIYGNVQLYQQLCSFNNIANCNVIEVGDVINLPTTAQINSGATAPATTAAPAATATPAATPAVSATTTATTTTAAPATTAVTTTATVTDTTAVTPTTGTTTGGTATGGTAPAAATQSIYDVLAANSNYSSLIKALDKAGLSSALDGNGEYTVFAPTNAAFTALRTRFNLSEAQFLALPELADTLRFHVLSGVTPVESLSDGGQAATLQGKAVNFEVDGSTAKVNGANIVANDIAASNGMIHVIDAVIIPPAE